MFLVDPCIYAPEADKTRQRTRMIQLGLSRRDRWSSREEAYKLLKQSAFGAWDDEVLRLYVENALTNDPREGVTLKCPIVLVRICDIDR